MSKKPYPRSLCCKAHMCTRTMRCTKCDKPCHAYYSMKDIEDAAISDEIIIGTRLWEYDENCRHYDKDRKIIEEQKYVERYVIADNSLSWIIAYDKDDRLGEFSHTQKKVNKKTLRGNMDSGYSGNQFYTDKQKEEKLWADVHRRGIVNAVDRTDDKDTLKAIADLVNYDSDL